MPGKKFTIDDYDSRMEDVRQRHRTPTGGLVERLREAAKRRRLPRLPKL